MTPLAKTLVPLLLLSTLPTLARADARPHLDAAQQLVKARKWDEALSEYAAAAESSPGDARLLSDLSWVAVRAGRFGQAKKAALASIAATRDARLMAASFYNLGLALDDGGLESNLGALAAYAAANVLRPGNRDVRLALAATATALGHFKVQADSEEPEPSGLELAAIHCARSLAEVEPWSETYDEDAPQPSQEELEGADGCETMPLSAGTLPAGVVAVSIVVERGYLIHEDYNFLLTGVGASWTVLANLGSAYRDERMSGADISGFSNFGIARPTLRKLAGHRVLTLEVDSGSGTTGGENDMMSDDGEASSDTTTQVLYCLLDEPASCPQRLFKSSIRVHGKKTTRDSARLVLRPDGTIVSTPRKGPVKTFKLW